MYRIPSRKSKKLGSKNLPLIPILDAVFIFIFFLLMSANFTKIFEIASDVPIVSEQEPPKDKKKPLALTLKISEKGIEIYTGVPANFRKRIEAVGPGRYDLASLHTYLIALKQQNMDEKDVVLEPVIDITYEELVAIMDAVRLLENTDPALYRKDKNGIDVRVEELFANVVFGNIQS